MKRNRSKTKPRTPRGIEARPMVDDRGPYWAFRTRFTDANGDRRSFTDPDLATVQDFKANLRLKTRAGELHKLDRGKGSLDAFYQRYVDEWAASTLTPAVEYRYRLHYNKYVSPYLGGEPLRAIEVADIERLARRLETLGVGPQARRATLVMLQSVLRQAVAWGEIGFNPCVSVRKGSTRRKTAIHPLPPEAVEALIAYLLSEEDPWSATLVSVLAYTGMRPQDALALQWSSVRERTIVVDHKLVDGEILEGQKVQGREPRPVRLLGVLRDDLAAWRAATTVPPFLGALVFPSAARKPSPWHPHRDAVAPGRPLGKSEVDAWRERTWASAVQAVGLPSTPPYHLRHSYISLRLRERDDVVRLAREVGNSPATIWNNYAHVMAELEESGSVRADELILRARKARRAA
jgi:integrase